MGIQVSAEWNARELAALASGPMIGAVKRALRKAGATALRDMRAEANKRIRARKKIRISYIGRALSMRRPRSGDIASMEWAIDVSGAPVPLVAYPYRQTKKGVVVEVNKGKRTLVDGSFLATMRSGHLGVFRRKGKARLPIEELRGSRPVDALLHKGETEGVVDRGGKSFRDTFVRVLPLEIGKGG